MKALSTCRFLMGVIAGVIFLSVGVALGGDGDKGALSPAPQKEPQFTVGSALVVAAESAKLMIGNEVVATVPQGQPIVVMDVRDSWVGTYVSVNGQERRGWIRTADFVPVNGPVKREVHILPVSEPTVSEPAPNPVRIRTRDPAQCDSSDYFREYNTGYYVRHETDPNIHVWEPWMSH